MSNEHIMSLTIEAIRTGQTLKFTYSDKPRVIEVHAVGLTSKSALAIRGYQVVGDREGWALFSADKIIDPELSLLPISHAPRPGYVLNDSQLPTIYGQVPRLLQQEVAHV